MTVPTLSNKTNKQETIARLKKAYSTMAQATNQIIAENGPVTSWTTTGNDVYMLYKKKLINAKECNKTTGCFTQGDISYLNGGTTNWTDGHWNKLVLQDGTQILFSDGFNSQCNDSNINNHDGSNNYCARFFVDLNGARKPNTYGRDIFVFVLKANGLYPAGCDNISLCSKDYQGAACACKVLREDKIDY